LATAGDRAVVRPITELSRAIPPDGPCAAQWQRLADHFRDYQLFSPWAVTGSNRRPPACKAALGLLVSGKCRKPGTKSLFLRAFVVAELAACEREDRQDADAFRLWFYTGLRLGELLTLRWEDVDLGDRLLLVRRGLSNR